jgi:hypothetical protein
MTKKRRDNPRDKGVLPKEEWDFSSLSDDDVFDCWEWEMFREAYQSSELLQKFVKIVRSDDVKFRPDYSELLWYCLDGYAEFPHEIWPTLPFLQVPIEKRQSPKLPKLERTTKPSSLDNLIELARSTREKGIPFPMADLVLHLMGVPAPYHMSLSDLKNRVAQDSMWIEYDGGAIYPSQGFRCRNPVEEIEERRFSTIVALQIEWTKTDAQLIQEFKKWIEQLRPVLSMSKYRTETGRNRDVKRRLADLAGLGASRLRRHYGSVDAAITQLLVKQTSVLPYRLKSEWSGGVKRCKRIVENIMQLEHPRALAFLKRVGGSIPI